MGRLIHNTAGKLIAKTKEAILAKSLKTIPDGVYFVYPKPPYISQLAGAKKSKIDGPYQKIHDLTAAKRFGAKNLEDFSFWAWRSCGIVGVQMILKSQLGENFKGKTMSLISEAKSMQGYSEKNDRGWLHSSLIALAQNYKVKSWTEKFVPASQIANHILNNRSVLVSVTSEHGGHLLLVYGVEIKGGIIKSFFVHDPYDFEERGESKKIPQKTFERLSTRRIIVFSKRGECAYEHFQRLN